MDGQQAMLEASVGQGPDTKTDGVPTWRLVDLCQIEQERFGVSYSETGKGKLMRSPACDTGAAIVLTHSLVTVMNLLLKKSPRCFQPAPMQRC